MRVVACLAVWAVCGMAALAVAALTKIGPVVVTFPFGGGLHLGDVVAVVIGTLIATAFTVVAIVTRPRESAPTGAVSGGSRPGGPTR